MYIYTASDDRTAAEMPVTSQLLSMYLHYRNYQNMFIDLSIYLASYLS